VFNEVFNWTTRTHNSNIRGPVDHPQYYTIIIIIIIIIVIEIVIVIFNMTRENRGSVKINCQTPPVDHSEILHFTLFPAALPFPPFHIFYFLSINPLSHTQLYSHTHTHIRHRHRRHRHNGSFIKVAQEKRKQRPFYSN